MRTIKGLNEKLAVLIPTASGEKVPTFKESLLSIIAIYRPEGKTEPADRIKTTSLGLMILTSRDSIELEGDYYDLLKKIVEDSNAYSEFIMGQWVKKVKEAEELKKK